MKTHLFLSVILLACFTIVHAQEPEIVGLVEKPMAESTQILQGKDASDTEESDSAALKHRRYILDNIERLRTAYNQKDIKFIEQYFNDSTLFIQGNVKTIKNAEGIIRQEIEYVKQTCKQYLSNMKKAFARNNHIMIHFEEIEINKHHEKSNIYGVLMMQELSSDNYHDKGYIFLLWDFTDENAPLIQVRTWQPAVINGKPFPKDKFFGLSDYDI